jgi:hypothetical protein
VCVCKGKGGRRRVSFWGDSSGGDRNVMGGFMTNLNSDSFN